MIPGLGPTTQHLTVWSLQKRRNTPCTLLLHILRFTNHEHRHSADYILSSATLENVFNKPKKITLRVFTLSSYIMGSVGSSGFGVWPHFSLPRETRSVHLSTTKSTSFKDTVNFSTSNYERCLLKLVDWNQPKFSGSNVQDILPTLSRKHLHLSLWSFRDQSADDPLKAGSEGVFQMADGWDHAKTLQQPIL